MVDDERWVLEGGIERALIETHHLANISKLPEAKLARRRLVAAQSADSLNRTRDNLEDASEFLELARLARRDCAAGFTRARDLVSRAEAALRFERPIPLARDPASLLRDGPEPRPTLEELEREAAVNSFEQLKYDVAIEEAFAEIRRRARGADDPSRHVHADPVTGSGVGSSAGSGVGSSGGSGVGSSGGSGVGSSGGSGVGSSGGSEVDPVPESTDDGAVAETEHDDREHFGAAETGSQPASREVAVEEALRLASLEVDIQRSLLRASASPTEAGTEFQFVSTEELASPEEPGAEES